MDEKDWYRKIPLRQLFIQILSLNSVDNEEAAEIYFHVFMGAYFKDVIIYDGITNKDLRVSLTWIQTSRTGKGRMNKAFQKVCEACGISCVIVTDYSVAGIIGSIDQDAVTHNARYEGEGLSEENPEIEIEIGTGVKTKTKKVQWRNPVIKGDAGNFDIIIFDELKILIDAKGDNEGIMLVLNPALDTPPYIRKKLRAKTPIEYSNQLSIIGTTFPFGSLSNVFAKAGYLQRTFLLIRNLTIEQIKEMNTKHSETVGDSTIKDKYKVMLEVFKDRLGKIKKTKKKLQLNDDGRKALREITDSCLKKAEKLKGDNREIMLGFSNTVNETALKIAGQYTLIHSNGEKDVILGHDIRSRKMLVIRFIEVISEKLEIRLGKEEQTELDRLIWGFKNKLKKYEKESLNNSEFRELIDGLFNLKEFAANNMIKKYVEQGFFIKEKGKGKGNIHLYKLSKK